MSLEALFPITVYGSSISYFTGKLENYFRLKRIPYRLQAMTRPHDSKRVRQHTGSTQMPALLLGDGPSLADISFSGPFFRHFGLDPVPAHIMRQQAPAVWEWAARLWNSGQRGDTGALLQGIPPDWGPILKEIGEHCLPYLCANIDAVMAGRKRFDADIGGVRYCGARSSKYRVWCLQQLRTHYRAFSGQDQDTACNLLKQYNCWEPLWRHEQLPIDKGLCSRLPFMGDAKMIDVYD